MKCILLITVLLSASFLYSQNPVCGFDYKKTITIDGGQVSGTVADFPILISHTDSDLTAAALKVTNANGFDIIFSDDNGIPLDFQLEEYNATTGKYTAWVKIPSLTNGVDLDIHMLYGKSTITTDQSTTEVWDADYTGVWHMNQDPSGVAPQITEASGGGDNGTANGTMTAANLVAGKAGNGIDFDGIDDFINIGDVLIDGTNSISIEAWVNTASVPLNTAPSGHNTNEGSIIHKNGASDDNLGITMSSAGTAFYIDEGSDNTSLGAIAATATWVHITATWDNATMRLYQNGVLDVSLGSVNGTFVNNNNQLRIGGGHGGTGFTFFDGIIDEIRISNSARNVDWINTSFNSQNQPTTTLGSSTAGDFYIVGAEREIQFISLSSGDWDENTRWNLGYVPTQQFDNVTITNHELDVDGGSANYTICDCDIIGNGSAIADLDVSSSRVFTTKGHLNANYSGSGTSRLSLRVRSTATVIVEGELEFEASNTSTSENMLLQLFNSGSLQVDSIFSMSGSAGNDIYLDMDDDATLIVNDNFTMSKSGGDDLRIDMEENASIIAAENMTFNNSGGDDFTFFLDGNSSISCSKTITINLTNGDDINIDVNNTATAPNTSSITTNNFVTNQTGGDEYRLDINRGGKLNILNDYIIDIDGATNSATMEYRLTLDNDAGTDHLKVGNDLIVTHDATNQNIDFGVENLSDFEVDGDVSIAINASGATGQDMQIQLIEDGRFSVLGNFTLIKNDGEVNSDIGIDIQDNAILEIGTDDGSLTNSCNVDFQDGFIFNLDIEESAQFLVYGDCNFSHAADGELDITLNENNADAGTSALMEIDGNFNLTKTDGDDLLFEINESSSFICHADVTISTSGHDNDDLLEQFIVSDNGLIDIDGSLNYTMDDVNQRTNLRFFADDNAEINIGIDNGALTESATFTILNGNRLNIDSYKDATIKTFGDFNISHAADSSVTLDVNFVSSGVTGALFQVDGSLNIAKTDGEYLRLSAQGNGTFTVGQDLSINSGSHSVTGNFENCQIDVSDNGVFTVSGNYTSLLNDVSNDNDLYIDLNNNGILNLGTNGTNTHSITMIDGNEFEIGIDDNAVMNVNGDITLNYNGNNAGAALLLNDVSGNNATLNVDGNLILNNNKNADEFRVVLQGSNSLLNVDGNIDISNAAANNRIEIELNSSSKIEIEGSFLRTGGFGELDCNGTSTVEFNGSTNAQIFSADAGSGTDVFDYQNVIINNTFGTNPQISMEGLATVHSSIIWTDGVVSSTAINLLVIDDNATSTLANNGSHCDGPVKKIGDDVFIFPTGDNDYYGGIEINSLTAQSATDEFTAQYFEAMHPESYFSELLYVSLGGISDNIKQTSTIEWWELSRDNGACEPIVRLYWTNNTRSQITNLSSLVVGHYLGLQTWQDEGGNNSGALTNGYVESVAQVTSFSPFTFGSTDITANPLPVELIDFNAKLINNETVKLTWETASEINNDYFEIEKTLDLNNWVYVDKINGAGNSNSNIQYFINDFSPLKGNSYYRLKQVDFNGTVAYSDVRKISLSSEGQVTVFPNPSSGIFNISVKEKFDDYSWTVYDGNGRMVAQSSINDTLTEVNISNLAKGIYMLQVTNNSLIITQKLSLMK